MNQNEILDSFEETFDYRASYDNLLMVLKDKLKYWWVLWIFKNSKSTL